MNGKVLNNVTDSWEAEEGAGCRGGRQKKVRACLGGGQENKPAIALLPFGHTLKAADA